MTLCNQEPVARVPVRLYNVGMGGIGITARRRFEPDDQLILIPEGVPDILMPEVSVHIRVIHCTQTVQGYKIGGVLI